MPNVPFWLAKQRYRQLRRQALDLVEMEALRTGFVRCPLRLMDTDEHTLAVWRATWTGQHPTGYGNWNWDRVLARAWRRPSAFHVAVWSGGELCGLGVGRLSKRRLIGVRHTVSVYLIESAHDERHPLRHKIAALVIAAAEAYGRHAGASRIRLIEPLPGVVRMYESYGFTVAWKAGQPLYCERRIPT